MPLAPAHIIEDPTRVAKVEETGLLDSPASPALDRLTRLTTRLLGVPTAVVTLIDRNRQFFAGSNGLDGELAITRTNSLDFSYCQHVVAQAKPLVIPNAAEHPLVFDNRATTELGIQAYAGMPLVSSDGQALGSFCAFDTKPHEWSEQDLQVLQDLAQAAMTEIELRFASRLLEEQGARLSELLENTDELVAQCGLDGALTYANAAWRRLFGDPPATPSAGYLQGFLAGTKRETFDTAWNDALHGEPSEDFEVGMRLPSGDTALIAMHMVPVLSRGPAHGSARGVRIYARDVTDLRSAQRAKDQVISLVSHELRTPIGAVQGAMQLLDRLLPEPATPKVRELVALAKRNADRLLGLVNDLLDLDRLEAGSAPLEPKDVRLADLFAPVRDATGPLAERGGVSLSFANEDLHVRGDAQWLAHVLINLVGNAIKFTPNGGAVRVEAQRDGAMIQVRVRDTGRGIPREQVERVFERFAQVERGDATEKGGSGLGLAIARAVVLQHHGRIWVESRVGEGSTFAFTLPSAH